MSEGRDVQAIAGCGIGMILASFRRFWAAAARWNSSLAPFGPRSRRRSSLRMRLRWANSISTFSRSDFSYGHERDVYRCPDGHPLTTSGTLVNDGATLLYRQQDRLRGLCAQTAMLSQGTDPQAAALDP